MSQTIHGASSDPDPSQSVGQPAGPTQAQRKAAVQAREAGMVWKPLAGHPGFEVNQYGQWRQERLPPGAQA